MLTRQHRLSTARLVLAMMLFAQGVMASIACDWMEITPDRAVLAAAEVAPCHESGFGGACLTHCLADRQAVQKVATDVPAMPPAPVLTLAAPIEALPSASPVFVTDNAPATGPPRRILLQSFQV